MDNNEFMRNWCSHALEELLPYEGKSVAWSLDGKRILAAADTEAELYEEIDRLGLKELEYVVGGVPISDVSELPGLSDCSIDYDSPGDDGVTPPE